MCANNPYARSMCARVDKTVDLFYTLFVNTFYSSVADLPDKGRIALALSGGRDSVALAHVLLSSGADFFAVHVEHGIRGQNSLNDAEFVSRFCKERGIELKTFSVDAPAFAESEGLTIEQAARELRYRIFGELLEKGECDYVALAHHADDQTETVLMRIFRGTGISGLRGMAAVSGGYIRPFLSVSRAQIDEYVKENKLPYVEDETNSDTAYTRNFLRQEVARIKQRYPALNDAVARLVRHACEADDFIRSYVPAVEEKDGEVRIAISELKLGLPAKYAVTDACRKLGVYQDIEERHFELVFRLAECENGKRIELPHGITVHKDGEFLVFAPSPVAGLTSKGRAYDGNGGVGGSENLAEGIAFPRSEYAEVCGVVISKVDLSKAEFGGGALYADADKIPDDAVLRTRREGDVFTKFGGGTKSFGDFLTDRKVPLRKRDGIVVCASGNDILFAVGVEVSDKVKIDNKTKNIIKITEDENVR